MTKLQILHKVDVSSDELKSPKERVKRQHERSIEIVAVLHLLSETSIQADVEVIRNIVLRDRALLKY